MKFSAPLVVSSAALFAALFLSGCGQPLNDPYSAIEKGALYRAFDERPKHLDPARSYSEEEAIFIGQIYMPPLQYHYLLRPYTLIPLASSAMPTVTYLDAKGRIVDKTSSQVAFSRYEIHIRPQQNYQPHPAFAQDGKGHLLYNPMPQEVLAHAHNLSDFKEVGTREVVAADYIYQIKRLASPKVHSPIFGLMSQYIVGLKDLGGALAKAQKEKNGWLDLDKFPLSGVEEADRYTYRITLKGVYPQFHYWLSLNFFAPVPREADAFYSQPGMGEKNFSLDWYPVGSGPYMLTENNPNSRMVLLKNPNFSGMKYPSEGEAADGKMLADAGKTMPFIDKVIYSREVEATPYWNKFLQGYYDSANVRADNFDQVARMGSQGQVSLSPQMEERGMFLRTSVSPSIYFLAFNWLDPVVGGKSEKAKKLRRALSIAVDWEEFVAIFTNGLGLPAQGPLPPDIFGYQGGQEGINPQVYDWQNGRAKRKNLEEAKKLLAEAGYADGINEKTKVPLTLYFDTVSGGSGDKARFDWYRKQFSQLGIQLEVRLTDYNRFQDKVRNGKAQMFIWGWGADYPDPENFLFLFYGPQSKVVSQGENAANYTNEEYDRLFERMSVMENSPEREKIIHQMVSILRQDAPWIFGFHPKSYVLVHGWMSNIKPNGMARNTLQYLRLDASMRKERQEAWNKPVLWPLLMLILGLALLVLRVLRRKTRA